MSGDDRAGRRGFTGAGRSGRRRDATLGPATTVERLRRLRIRLTVLFSLANLIGLAALGTTTTVIDSTQRSQAMTMEMRDAARQSRNLVYFDDHGRIQTDSLVDDEAVTGPSRIVVFAGKEPAPPNRVFSSDRRKEVDPAKLLPAARAATAHDTEVWATVAGRDGAPRRVLALAFYADDDQTVAGAVVAVRDPRPTQTAHEQLVVGIVAGVVALALLSGLAGHLLARRSLRPAADALAQHERFLADAAHELRHPLSVIRATAESSLGVPADPASDRFALRRIVATSARLSESVEALLTHARFAAGKERPRPVPVRLDQLVEDVAVELVVPPHELRIDTGAGVARVDPDLIRIAVRNLVDNAVRHGRSPDGHAVVEVACHQTTVTVRDHGSGPGGGVAGEPAPRGGIGLALARWVADTHGGTLELTDADGGGTLATLALPADPPDPPAAEPAGRRWSGRLGRILRSGRKAGRE